MPEPLVVLLARHTLPLITEAWGLAPHQILTRPGPAEMAHHFLKIELGLSYDELHLVLQTSFTLNTAYHYIQRGDDYYNRWPAYHRRYHQVKTAIMQQFALHELDHLSSSSSGC